MFDTNEHTHTHYYRQEVYKADTHVVYYYIKYQHSTDMPFVLLTIAMRLEGTK